MEFPHFVDVLTYAFGPAKPTVHVEKRGADFTDEVEVLPGQHVTAARPVRGRAVEGKEAANRVAPDRCGGGQGASDA